MKKIIFLIMLLNFSGIIFAQEYFPLKLGNRFKYYYFWRINQTGGTTDSGHYIINMKISDTATFFNKKYYYCTGGFSVYYNAWLRVDSITKSLYKYTNSGGCSLYYKETIIDSLGMLQAGYQNYCADSYYFGGKSDDILFNIASYKKRFTKLHGYGNNLRDYNSLFGLKQRDSSLYYGTNSARFEYKLIGCVINGIGYGDTSLANINLINSNIPESFSLEQNYPNPFNSITNIKWKMSDDGDVKITVFDLLGREVAVLVNQELKPGTYEVTFDVRNYNSSAELPSGIYLYQLETKGFSETKKLVIIK